MRPAATYNSGNTTSFNPRTHTGCDAEHYNTAMPSLVSIHAPTRGATTICSSYNYCNNVSIHAPTRGATWLSSHENDYYFVSIHAPTRGATDMNENGMQISEVSIHAPTRGATLLCAEYHVKDLFQSTHPHGVRPLVG